MRLIDADDLYYELVEWLSQSVGPVHNTLEKVIMILARQEEISLGEAVDRTIETMRRLP